jgi:iron(II)-dependent oxidoreductase
VDKDLPNEVLDAIKKELFSWDKKYPSAYGLMHMAGNAAEWVYDVYDPKYYGLSPTRDPQGPEKGTVHVCRGGSYLSGNPAELTTYARAVPRGASALGGCTEEGRPFIGFRCAKSLDIVVPKDKPVSPAK